jgi:F-type H+-transporting ATP synthase subunit e
MSVNPHLLLHCLTLQVLRWSALGFGIFYGFYHQASINARDRLHASKAEYSRRESLISQAKAEYAKSTAPPATQPVASSKTCQMLLRCEADSADSSQSDDLEAFPWLQESK